MNSDEQQLYDTYVLGHIEQPYHRGSFPEATHRQRIDNPVCGDSVQLELRVEDSGVISEAWFTATGCIISQAAASMLVEYIEDRALRSLQSFTAQDMLQLFRARLTPYRQQCCLLSWQALRQLIARVDETETELPDVEPEGLNN